MQQPQAPLCKESCRAQARLRGCMDHALHASDGIRTLRGTAAMRTSSPTAVEAAASTFQGKSGSAQRSRDNATFPRRGDRISIRDVCTADAGQPKPRKGVKGPSVPCGVSFPFFFPLLGKKEDRRRQPLRHRRWRCHLLTQGRLGRMISAPTGTAVFLSICLPTQTRYIFLPVIRYALWLDRILIRAPQGAYRVRSTY